MDQVFIQWIITQVGLAGVAGLCIYLLNRVWSERLSEQREDKAGLLAAYKENISTMKEVSANLSRQSEAFDRLCAKVDRPG